MIYPKNFETKTGFRKIRAILKDKCLGGLGIGKVYDMAFGSDEGQIKRQLLVAKEFRDICLLSIDFPQDNYIDTRNGLKKISIENTYLTQQELFDLKQSCETLRSIIQFFKRTKENEFPNLRVLCADIFVEQPLIQSIQRVMDEKGEIRDDASPELRKIRAEIRAKSSSISTVVNRLLRNAKQQGWCETDAEVNIRDGKMLIPIKSFNKRKISGIVCDESATGKTAFIEPLESIELNNAIRELTFQEKREIIKILIETSDKIRPYIPELLTCNEILAELDFSRAKALMAIDMQADMPAMTSEPICDIRIARHPILELTLKAEGKKAIPLDIEITHQNRIVMISGPNAGGKSVCLKTVGLIQYMHQCGLLTPISSNSRLGIFKDIFIDIGDEQSIENDLSTYSSHLNNMKQFLDNAGKRSLILIDEFGTGTEPILGGAIAEAILDNLNKRKVKGVITTHYTNLKNYATVTEGLVNGAMLFDNTNMKPLFILEIGKIGHSFAFEMAQRIGIDSNLLKKAEEIAGREHIDYERRMQELEEDKRRLSIALNNATNHEKQLQTQEEKYRTETEYTISERKNILKAYKTKYEQIIKESNRMIERTILEIKNAQAERNQTRELRKQLEDFKKSTFDEFEKEDNKIDEIKNRLNKKQQEKTDQRNKKRKDNSLKEKPLQPGDIVFLDNGSIESTIIEIKDGKAIIEMGIMQSIVDIKRLSRKKQSIDNKQKEESKQQIVSVNFKTEKKSGGFLYGLDVRGLRGDEALERVAKYIDEALTTGHREIKILHGTGTGALRQLIRDYLKAQPIVKSCQDEKIEHGGAGITVVTLDY